MNAELLTSASAADFAAVRGVEKAHDVATALIFIEVDALARLLRAHGHGALADSWVEEHSRSDGVDDAHSRTKRHPGVP